MKDNQHDPQAHGQAQMGREDATAPQGQTIDQATPEENQQLKQASLAAFDVIYNEKTRPGIEKMLQAGAADPAQALASATTTVVTGIDEQSGGQLPEVIIFPLASQVLSDLTDMAGGQGYFEVSEQVKNAAMQQTLIQLGEQYEVDPEAMQQLIEEMGPDQVQAIVQQQGGQVQ